ncbi:hypothetical protein [Streptomyces sp. SID13031]|uniref:hypothetical protein n=1 Tax=Streptomyces sp. SID13031 TaxID=2706046 RepID=UPI0013CD94C2|nr:hypothetical protein [Streptomyces sp. SID13031]NEA30762.1 hypothetical protein [Streptomyces sp. SID13031]
MAVTRLKSGHAEVDGREALLQPFHFLEFVLGSGEADFQSVDFAEPSLAFRFLNA